MLLALGLGPTACRGCGCVSGEKVYEKIDGKVKVSLVRSTGWTKDGKGVEPHSSFHLHVETTPAFDEPLPPGCSHVDMAEDDDGKNVAYRCKRSGEWTVLRLRGADRRVRECNATVGTGDKPRFEDLTPVRVAVPRIAECSTHQGEKMAYQQEQLVRAVIEDDGVDAGVEVGASLAKLPLKDSRGDDPWVGALAALDASGRDKLMSKTCEALSSNVAIESPPAYVRAALRCPVDAPAVIARARDVLAARLADGLPPKALSDAGTDAQRVQDNVREERERALLWAARIAVQREPASAGNVACDMAGTRDPSELRAAQHNALLFVLGRTKTACPAVERWLVPTPCSPALDCDGGLCDYDELLASFDGDVGIVGDAGVRVEPKWPAHDQLLMFALRGGGSLPIEFATVNDRRHYPITSPDGGLCTDEGLDAGAPCRCTELNQGDICRSRASEATFRHAHCAVHFDDKKRRIDDVRRACERQGVECDTKDRFCCGGLRCTNGKCEPKPN